MRTYTANRVYSREDEQTKEKKEFKSRITIDLDTVLLWEEYVYPDTFLEYPGEKTYVVIGDNWIILCVSFKKFDRMMKRKPKTIGHRKN